MATSITMETSTTAGKKSTRSITNVNPDATNSEIKNFVTGLNELTTNTLESVNRIDKTTIDTDITYTTPYIKTDITGTHIVKVDDFNYTVDVSQSYSATNDAESIMLILKVTSGGAIFSLDGANISYSYKRTTTGEGFLVGSLSISRDGIVGTDAGYGLGIEFYNDTPDDTNSGVLTIRVPSVSVTVGTNILHSEPITFTFTVTGAK